MHYVLSCFLLTNYSVSQVIFLLDNYFVKVFFLVTNLKKVFNLCLLCLVLFNLWMGVSDKSLQPIT